MKNENRIKVGIAGGAGYTGGELIRLLLNHPHVDISFVNSKSNAGKMLSVVHRDLEGETSMMFSDRLDEDIDVLFLCLAHGESRKFLSDTVVGQQVKIIDLSQDFRLMSDSVIGDRRFVYGLAELNRAAIQSASNVANPGCFATALQLALLPLANKNLLEEAYATGITGSTGAGQSLSPTAHFSWRANNISAYKTLQHQHMQEIMQSLQQLQTTQKTAMHFVPWRGDFARGIFISTTVGCDLTEDEVMSLYQLYYSSAAFTHVCQSMIDLKQVVNTNKCLIYPEKAGDKLVIHATIDNLLKGASGQALQNMNLMFGFDEKAGLNLKGTAF